MRDSDDEIDNNYSGGKIQDRPSLSQPYSIPAARTTPVELSSNDLMILKEALVIKWETHRPEGDEVDLYQRLVKELRGR